MKKLITALCCAAVLGAFVAPGARADEYTKQTFLTFSGPVQVPGATLPAGTYMFKLADPESGRRAIQIWDKEGGKLIATLLTIPNERMEAPDEPVVLFSEQPAGTAHAVKAWFYPGDRIGQEFIYPRDQAMRIARDAQTAVLSYNDVAKPGEDTAAMRGAKIGRVDAAGQVAEFDAEAPEPSAASTASNTTATAAAAAPSADVPTPNRSAASSASAPDVTSGTSSPAASENPQSPGGTAAAAANPAATEHQANRSGAPAPAATVGTTSPSTTAGSTQAAAAPANDQREQRHDAPVGTSGQAGAANAPAADTTADRAADTASARQELPRTGSPLAAIGLLAGLSLLGGVGVRQVRRRYATDRN
jgi:hypothetical protein